MHSSKITWGMLVIGLACMLVGLWQFRLIPFSWKLIILAILLVVMAGLYFLSWKKRSRRMTKIILSLVNLGLALTMVYGGLYLVRIQTHLDEVFEKPNQSLSYTYEVYGFKKSAKQLSDYAKQPFYFAQMPNQDIVLKKLRTELNVQSVQTKQSPTLWQALADFYQQQDGALIVNTAYVSTIEENPLYANFTQETVKLTSVVVHGKKEAKSFSNTSTQQDLLIYIGGNDQEGSLANSGRMDLNILMKLNLRSHKITLISIPRDSYIENPAYQNQPDKLTHLSINGVDNTLSGINQWLGTDIQQYAVVNFSSFQNIIDTLGGIDVYNSQDFISKRYQWHYPVGQIHLDGAHALEFVRERYALSRGDFDRNRNEVRVLMAIFDKLKHFDSITKLDDLMVALNGSVLTNISTDSLYQLAQTQVDHLSQWTVDSYHINGQTGSAECASVPGESLSVVYPSEVTVNQAKQKLKNQKGT